jgi:S-adenosylmethionine decarboxylase proenzyme
MPMPDDPDPKKKPLRAKKTPRTKDVEVPTGTATKTGPPEFLVMVSMRFIILSVLSSMLVAFAVGQTARRILLANPKQRFDDSQQHLLLEQSTTSSGGMVILDLPDPVMKNGKVAPITEYFSKTFDTTRSSSTQSRWVVTAAGKQQPQCVDDCKPTEQSSSAPFVDLKDAPAMEDTEGESHLPAGQHLLMDIENVNEAFLNSEKRLAHAMLNLVDVCGLTLLSYHCHTLIPMGVSCAGVLLESHVSFHTWPKQGVITLDLYTCGPESLLPIVTLAEKLFAIPRDPTSNEGSEVDQPNMVWSHKLRGFHDDESGPDDAFLNDMNRFPVRSVCMSIFSIFVVAFQLFPLFNF